MPIFDGSHHFSQANIYLNQGRYAQAIFSYKELLKREPDNIIAHNNLGVAYYQSGNTQEAVLSYQNAIKRKADYFDAVYNLAILLKNEHILSDAAHYFYQAVRIDKKNILPMIGLAQTYILLGEIEKSLLIYTQAIQLSPHNAELITEAAKLEMQLKHYVQAESLFTQALHINPRNPYAWQNLGLCLKMQGKMEKALEFFKFALALNAGISSIQYTLGVIYYEMGMITNAMEHLEKAFILDPSLREDYGLLPILKTPYKYSN